MISGSRQLTEPMRRQRCVHRQLPGSETSAYNTHLLMRLLAWANSVGSWQVFDSSTGLLLPVVARLLRRSWLGEQPDA